MGQQITAGTIDTSAGRGRRRSMTWLGIAAFSAVALVGTACSRGGDDSAVKDTRSVDSTTTEATSSPDADFTLDLGKAPVAETVSDRFQSFNLEMASVVGGSFWAPRDDPSGKLMADHPPVELDERLTNLASKLGPTYMRVSGSWANKVYFDDSTNPPTDPPEGFGAVLSAKRWSQIGDFSKTIDAPVVTSFSVGNSTRTPEGVWTPELARRFLEYSKNNGIDIKAAEFINEPNIQGTSGASYDAAGFARDFKTLRDLRDQVNPDMRLLGPGGMVVTYELSKALDDPTTEELLETSADLFDDFSFHSYTGMSSRCPSMAQVPVDRLMDRDVLAVPVKNITQSRQLRDRFMPDAKIWLTETATAACGGDESAPTFKGAFAYLEHLADAARNGVFVYMYNTLVASDYGLIDDRTHMPRPSYWGAYLWKLLMGTKSLDIGTTNPVDEVSVYGHCSADGTAGSVTALISNRNPSKDYVLDLGSDKANVLTMTSSSLTSGDVQVNGKDLKADDKGQFTEPEATSTNGRSVTVAPNSLTFVTLPDAGNDACR